MSIKDQRSSGHCGLVAQWVHRTSGTMGTEDQRTRGTVRTEDQWVQRTRGTVDQWTTRTRGQ